MSDNKSKKRKLIVDIVLLFLNLLSFIVVTPGLVQKHILNK